MPSLPRRHRPAPGPPLQQATRFLSRELDLHYEYASVSRIVMRAARLAGINPATAHPNKASTSQAPSASDAIVSGNAASKRNTPTNTPRSDDSSAPTAIAPAQLSRPINSPSNITTRLMRVAQRLHHSEFTRPLGHIRSHCRRQCEHTNPADDDPEQL